MRVAFPPELQNVILPSDSRRRPDRFYLERGHSDLGTQWKKICEYRQRSEHEARGSESWNPVWFKHSIDPRELSFFFFFSFLSFLKFGLGGEPFWNWTGKYWDLRDRRNDEIQKGNKIDGVRSLFFSFIYQCSGNSEFWEQHVISPLMILGEPIWEQISKKPNMLNLPKRNKKTKSFS